MGIVQLNGSIDGSEVPSDRIYVLGFGFEVVELGRVFQDGCASASNELPPGNGDLGEIGGSTWSPPVFEEHLDLAYALRVHHVCKGRAAIIRGAVDDCPGSALPVSAVPCDGTVGDLLD